MNQSDENHLKEKKLPYAVYINDQVISEGHDPLVVFQNAELKITHGGKISIFEGPFIHQKNDATVAEIKVMLRGLSKGIALWVIFEAYQLVKKNQSDMMIMGLTEAESVVFIVKNALSIPSTHHHGCCEAILNTVFSPQYLSRTYSRASSKMTSNDR